MLPENNPGSPIVKICGLSDKKTLGWAMDSGADMVGFMHFAKSPRHVEPDQIASLLAFAGQNIDTVVVLVNPDDALAKRIGALKPRFIQLHGGESLERVRAIRKLSGAKIIKVLPVATKDDLLEVEAFCRVAEHILLDAKPPEGASRPGGLGKVFDWDVLLQLDPALKFMLSGGLNPDNVAQAISGVAPWGIDVSSGVESAPGVKNKDLIEAFVRNARAGLENRQFGLNEK